VKAGFLDKLVERLDKLDPQNLQTQFLKLVQERGLLDTIFHSIQEGVVAIDARGRINYANRAAEHYLGFSLESAQGRPVSRYLREIEWDRVLRFEEGEWSRLISREIEVTYPEHRFLHFYVVPMAEGKGPDEGVVVILRDITQVRMQEASLLESERLNAVKLLAAGVAHEIGNPLNALTIHLQLLEREIRELRDTCPQASSTPEAAPVARGRRRKAPKGVVDAPTGHVGAGLDQLTELVGVARNEVARLDLIITQFLRAIRPSKPKVALTSVEQVLEETLSLIKPEVENRKIEIEVNYPDVLPKVRVDRNQIKQAFFNIIRNAFQAMPDGGALRVTLSHSDHFLVIAFRDTGVGIKSSDLGRVFEPYFTTKTDGTGLGLMIVQRIVQDHGGQIEVASKPNEGTCFTLFLPLAERRVRLLKGIDSVAEARLASHPEEERSES
jgi:PAS domain S-box-containing protein